MSDVPCPPANDIPSLVDPAQRAGYIASLDCVHCGLCLEHCPTYRQTGRESANPRGRLYLMRALMEGRAEPTPDLTADLDLCLVCRACESVCPSGVRFGEVMAQTRSELRKPGFFRRKLMSLLYRPRALNAFASLLRFYQVSGLRIVRHLLPKKLKRMEAYAPKIPTGAERKPLPRFTTAVGSKRGAVAVLEGCVMRTLFQSINRETILLLSAAGFDVHVPESQTCCGALHEHDGDLQTTKRLLRQNLQAFSEDPQVSHLVINSSGCGAGLKGASHLIERGEGLASKVVDISRFLLDHGQALSFNTYQGPPVTYDAPCHLHHAQRETTAPIQLIESLPGVELRPMDLSDLCCGAAGIYNLDHPDMAQAILEEKLDALEATGAKVLLTGNPGCLMQWQQGIAQRGLDIAAEHPASFMAKLLQSH